MDFICKFIGKFEFPIVLASALYILCSYFACLVFGLSDRFYFFTYMEMGVYLSAGFAIIYALYLCLRIYWILFFIRPEKARKYIWDDLKAGPMNMKRYRQAIPVFLSFFFFLSAFTSMKTLIPEFNPFIWDDFLKNLDEFIHFGYAPWKLLHPVIGYPVITFLLNIVYNAWLPALFAVLYYQLFSLKNPQLRARFLLSFILVWAINGTVLATLLSSAGPCYFDYVSTQIIENPYTSLLSYIHEAAQDYTLWTPSTQQKLWQTYIEADSSLGAGISAMPSVHVATAFLFVLLGFSSDKKIWRILSLLFFVLILVGSIHLAWHYAVDGYAAIMATYFIWKLTDHL